MRFSPFCFKKGVWRTYGQTERLSTLPIVALIESRDGDLWLATTGVGVVRFDGDRFRTYTRPDGLISETVHTLVEDSKGDIWIGTSDGVSCWNGQRFQSQ